ncbi:sensor histidine kinase [Mucilaginibacter sp. CSA2-8R]|uniref:sensor histidine kinase n=1 Tax=Mucilaginibacter sp. CSA2-8R TaxID=3141542 RepID=UPI00315C90DF
MNDKMQSNFLWRNVKPHLVFWGAFIVYELGINYSFSGGHFSTSWLDILTFYPLNIGLFYLHSLIIFYFSTNGRPVYLIIALLTALEIVFYLSVKYGIVHLYLSTGIYNVEKNETLTKFIINGSWRAGYFIVISSAFAFGRLTVSSIEKINQLDEELLVKSLHQERLAKDLLATENAFLKAQINPHFIFNMLSYMHNQVCKYSESLGDVMLSFAEMMRYAFTNTDKEGKVPLEAELEHIKHYINLTQSRFNNSLQLNFKLVGSAIGLTIAPMLIVTLIENVFKYGELANENCPARIEIEINKNNFSLLIFNVKGRRRKLPSNGVGMSNVRSRLLQLYNDRHHLGIKDLNDTYELNLSIEL